MKVSRPLRQVHLTGNPVVDSLRRMRDHAAPAADLVRLLESLADERLLVVTTHRRENFGPIMSGRVRALRRFVERREDVAVVFPVHPNPSVVAAAQAELGGVARIHRIAPLDYPTSSTCSRGHG